MALTDDESQRLRDIAGALSRDDPSLCKALATGRPPHSRTFRSGKIGILCALVPLVIGIVFQQALLCVTGWIAIMIGVLMMSSDLAIAAAPQPPQRRRG